MSKAMNIASVAYLDTMAQQAVKERGRDYVYTPVEGTCHYFVNGKPSCIVGLILSYLGATEETVRDCNIARISTLFHGQVVTGSETVVRYLTDLQDSQDDGRPWGEALDKARQGTIRDLEAMMRDIQGIASVV